MDPPTYHTVHWNDCGDGSLSRLIYLLVGGGPKWLRANCLDSDDNGGSSSSSPPPFPPPPKSLLICQLKQQSCLHLCLPLPIVVHRELISSNMSIPTTSKGDSPWPTSAPWAWAGEFRGLIDSYNSLLPHFNPFFYAPRPIHLFCRRRAADWESRNCWHQTIVFTLIRRLLSSITTDHLDPHLHTESQC